MMNDALERFSSLSLDKMDYRRRHEELDSIDTHSFLASTRQHADEPSRKLMLARTLTLADYLVGNVRTIVEFGAAQICRTYAGLTHPGIAHFFAVHGDEFPFSYYAWDAFNRISIEWMLHLIGTDRKSQQWREQWCGEGHAQYELQGKDPQIVQRLHGGVLVRSFLSYTAAAEHVERAAQGDDVPVVFSNHVLNYPSLRANEPFWTLPGVHVHQGFFGELCSVRRLRRSNVTAMFKERFGLRSDPLLSVDDDRFVLAWVAASEERR